MGIRPLPRRDHQAILISNNEYMLIYGGKNDNAFSYSERDIGSRLTTSRLHDVVYNEIRNSSLDDIMLFNLATRVWTAVSQRGWRPEARWSAAIAYHEQTKQLFIFGGTGTSGSCRNDVYCCELDPNRVSFRFNELLNKIVEVEHVSKRMISNARLEIMMK